MAPSQRAAIAEAIDEMITPDSDAAEGLCCTMEATNAAGESVTIQVMRDSLNISPYGFTEEPMSQLAACGATDGLDAELELVDSASTEDLRLTGRQFHAPVGRSRP